MEDRVPHVRDADEAMRNTLADVLRDGADVEAGKSASLSSEKPTREILHYGVRIEDPRERLPNLLKNFNLPGAVARFVWMMAANDRLKDIEFYWGDRVSRYTDDGMTVPGSDYGKRMLSPRPGLNQIASAIERLKEDLSSRRAAISIYAPEDAVRESHDIPCAFGLMFHVRNGRLSAAVFMRSNNAVTLLPYNIFEFSLLTEVVAASLGVPLGSMFYFAGSMHVFAEMLGRAKEIVSDRSPIVRSRAVPVMPADPSPIEQISALIRFEADARHAASGFTESSFGAWLDRVEHNLHEYWRQFAFLLLLEMARKRQLQSGLDLLRTLIVPPWRDFIPDAHFQSNIAVPAEGLLGVAVPAVLHADDAGSVTMARIASLDRLCGKKSTELFTSGGTAISFDEYRQLRDRLVGDIQAPASLAARGLPRDIAVDEFEAAFKETRPGNARET